MYSTHVNMIYVLLYILLDFNDVMIESIAESTKFNDKAYCKYLTPCTYI